MFDPERIRRARREAQLSQAALAKQIGKSADTVRGYEKGRIEPPGSVVNRIAAATGRPATWFVGEGTTPPATTADEGVRPPRARRRSRAVASYDPDEPAMPGGLQQLIDMGLPLRQDELDDLVGFADPRDTTRGARGAMGWTPGQWLDVLIKERRKGRG
ncbi:MAG: helix-turn-helix transcriptional regulator [Armatimonadetes bacterium]|nr:helix-turn-helix transcriptional regulator [Armatimonadota bacterium]